MLLPAVTFISLSNVRWKTFLTLIKCAQAAIHMLCAYFLYVIWLVIAQ